MSFHKRAVLGILALAGFVFLDPGRSQNAPPHAPSVVCPAMVSVSESALPVPGWSSRSDPAQHRFERISVANRDGEKEYDLAPDEEKPAGAKVNQTWKLNDYRDLPLFLTCRYQDTSVTLSKELPKALSTCSQTIEVNKSGAIVGQSSMSCQ